MKLRLGAFHGSDVIREGNAPPAEVCHHPPFDRTRDKVQEDVLELLRRKCIEAAQPRFGKIADRLQHRLPRDRVVDRAAWWTDKLQNRYEDICRRLRCQSGQVELTKRFGWSETLEVTNNAQQSAGCGAG